MCSTEMSAEKILALVLSIMCWSACRTLSRMRERGDRMSGAVATTLAVQRERERDVRWRQRRGGVGCWQVKFIISPGRDFRPSPLFEQHEQQGGHHGAEAQARHGRGCRELREAERAASSCQTGSQSRKKKKDIAAERNVGFLTAALVPSRTSMKSFSLVASSDRCITSD